MQQRSGTSIPSNCSKQGSALWEGCALCPCLQSTAGYSVQTAEVEKRTDLAAIFAALVRGLQPHRQAKWRQASAEASKQASKQADAHHRAHYPIAACTIVCGFRYPSHLPAAVKVWLSRLLKRSNLWQGENTLLNITVGKFPFTTEFVFFFLLFSLSFSFLSCKSGQFCTSSIHDWPHCQKCDSPSRKRNCTSTVTAFFFLVGFDTISPHSLV